MIKQLERLLNESNNEKQKFLIKKDLTIKKNGFEAEKENAYFLDFYIKDLKNTILLHDIRLEHNGLTAQIDHLLINPMQILVLERRY